MIYVKAEIEEIRSHANAEHIAELEYVDAEIITKGAQLLDPPKLPPTKGPLDGFTKAEKVAAETFMVETGHGTSYTT
ncbi:hypothetical protein C2857_000084 [Epichloe festucae Fl1]|uniref:Uncharacterized protein n=1 Tax=Epichloe festucae (strain Fl1) TaxID=877507 RepID=A0A7U3Q0Y9_EPIFF|nr:hypothetical protein C2857_000084 [Epichloe festucae Fl1]